MLASRPGYCVSMATMAPANKSGKRRRGKCKNRKLTHRAPPDGLMSPAVDVSRPKMLNISTDLQGLSGLHEACLHGQLAKIQLLLDATPGRINSGDKHGRRPVHMVLSFLSFPNTTPCVRYLLEHGADVNVATDSGLTPLHLAASEDLLDCAEILVQAGADVSARDSMGYTPLDLARIWCCRKVARYLKSCMWQKDKDKEMKERKRAQDLYKDLVAGVRLYDLKNKTLIDEKTAEWAHKKGFPLLKDFTPRVQVSKFHTKCLSSDQDASDPTTNKDTTQNQGPKKPPASSHRPWTVYQGNQPERPPKGEPDLRSSVTVWRDSSRPFLYSTKWDGTPRRAPDLPLDVLERVLFPRAFPSRIASPRHLEAQDIREVQRRGYPQGWSTSPWTEVAMHLVEVLESGHY